MESLNWIKVGERIKGNIYATIFEGYKKVKEKRGIGSGHSWLRGQRLKVVFDIVQGKKKYRLVRYFSPTLFAHSNVFSDRLNYWLTNVRNYMSKKLTIKDFEWIVFSNGKTGYYSFKEQGYEICLERNYVGWRICLCNKWEEVLDEKLTKTQRTALREANEYYCSFVNTGI